MEPKSVLVTGANRGLGLEFIKQFVKLEKSPVHIFAACRDPEKAEELQRITKEAKTVKIIKLEIKNLESAKTAADEVTKIVGANGLNLLVNNAGVSKSGSPSTATEEDLMENFRVNTVGPILVSQAFLPLLKTAAQVSNLKGQSCSKAAIINVSSTLGSISRMTGHHPTTFPYNLSKTALNMTTKMLSLELKDDNILVMSVCPGWVQTDMGTANAALTPEQSIGALLKILSKVDEKDTGTFRSQDGSVIEW